MKWNLDPIKFVIRISDLMRFSPLQWPRKFDYLCENLEEFDEQWKNLEGLLWSYQKLHLKKISFKQVPIFTYLKYLHHRCLNFEFCLSIKKRKKISLTTFEKCGLSMLVSVVRLPKLVKKPLIDHQRMNFIPQLAQSFLTPHFPPQQSRGGHKPF